MVKLPKRIALAFAADDPELLEEIIAAKRGTDFTALRAVATNTDGDFTPSQRRKALFALGRWGDARAVSDVITVLPDLDDYERIAAIDALGHLGGDQALQALARHYDDDSENVRKFVVTSLRRIGNRGAVEVLNRMMANEREADWIRDLAEQPLE